MRAHHCWFGGGTAVALRYGEFRESADVDFLVADLEDFRALRQRLRGERDLAGLSRPGAAAIALEGEVRADRYGIRAFALIDAVPIKLEIVSEGRIALDPPTPADAICGVAALTDADLAASKLLANSDRWADDSVFARDAIDLAMLDLPPRRLAPALCKAVPAYGPSVVDDMRAALRRLHERPAWLPRCMRALAIHMPPAVMQQKLRLSARRLDAAADRLGRGSKDA